MADSIHGGLARLSGVNVLADESIIAELVATASPELILTIGAELNRSHWPRCIGLASALARIGTEDAKSALVNSLRAKRHHIRTASINALVTLGDPSVAELFRTMLDDPAFETRVAAKDAIRKLTGQSVPRARGE